MSDVALNLAGRIGRPRIPLSKIDAVVAEHLGPARVRGNARPNVLYRHIAMYLGKHVLGGRPKPAIDGRLKTGQRETHSGH
jgi:hypothetical protein